eukprot:TRINITY_DN1669_c0_g2_i1.p1 TRINITY_DN1669_c0_g2~~TRINITY_DN1669_c0_g2_i1.p1  ORF type:complete len:322 (-),score=77.29 TRINITY_DN1669_c0_g2_i1:42-1007(-)
MNFQRLHLCWQSVLTYDKVFISLFCVNPNWYGKGGEAPVYLSHNWYANQQWAEYMRANYTMHVDRSVVLAALDFHMLHTIVFSLDGVGMRTSWEKRTRVQRDQLEAVAVVYAYSEGLFTTSFGSNSSLAKCPAAKDPARFCGLSAGGYVSEVMTSCQALDQADEVYDYDITWADVQYFVQQLQATYPYMTVGTISLDWAQILSDANEAFTSLHVHRIAVDSTYAGISFRYDFRALLAVLRVNLPEREPLTGPSFEAIDHHFYGIWLTDEAVADSAQWPLSSCSLAGSHLNACGAKTATSAAQAVALPSLVLLCFLALLVNW